MASGETLVVHALAWTLLVSPAPEGGAEAAEEGTPDAAARAPEASVSERGASAADAGTTDDADSEGVRTIVVGADEAWTRARSAEAVTVVDLEAARQRSADLGDVLARQSGLSVRRAGGLGSAMLLSLNGLGADQIRIFHNGVPLEYAGFGFGLANVPVNFVDRVEIHRGVVPLRYGSDALGGAIDLVTREDRPGVHGSYAYQTGSFNTHRLVAANHYVHPKLGVLAGASAFFDHSDNDYPVDVQVPDASGRLEPARVERTHNRYRAYGGRVTVGAVGRRFADHFVVTGYAADHDAEVQHNVTMTVPYGEVVYGRTVAGANVRWDKTFPQHWRMEAIAGYGLVRTRLHDLSTCVYDWYGRCIAEVPQPGEIDRRGYDQWILDHAGFGRVHVERRLGKVHALRLTAAPTGVVRTGDDRRVAAGSYDPLASQSRLVSFISGLEYRVGLLGDRIENIAFVKDYLQVAQADEPLPSGVVRRLDTRNHGLGAGNGFRVHATDWLMVKASYEWAMRLPRVEEMFGDGVLVIDNLHLKPERSHNVNLTFDVHTGGSFGWLDAEVHGFGRFPRDMIRQHTFGPSNFQYQNLLAARILGVESSIKWTSPGHYVDLGGNVTYQDARNTSGSGDFEAYRGDRLRNQPYLLANGFVALLFRDLALRGDAISPVLMVKYVHPFYLYWESAGRTDTKATVGRQLVLDLGLGYVVTGPRVTVSTSLDVQNVLDRAVYDFYGVQRMGRAAFGKVTLTF